MATSKKIEIKISADATGFRKSINSAASELNKFGRDLKGSLTTAGGQQFNGLVNGFKMVGVAAAAAAATGVYLFASGMKDAIDKAVQFQGIERAMIAVSGGAKLAAGEMEFLRKEAARLGLDLLQVGDSYKGIFAASKGTILAGEETRKIFSAISEVAVTLGMSTDDLQGSLRAVGQMMSKGKIQAEELRGQLGDRLPMAINVMAESMGVSTFELGEMMKAGDVGIDVLKNFAKVLHDTYGPAAENTDSYSKATAGLSNAHTQLQIEAGKLVINNSFVIESVKILSQVFVELRNHVVANRNELVSLVKVGLLGLVTGIGGAIEVVRFFYNGWQGLSLAAHGAVTVILKGMELASLGIQTALFPMNLFLTALEKIGVIDSNPLADFVETMKGVSKVSADEFNSLLDKVGETNGQFDGAKAAVEDFKRKISEIPAEYKDTAQQMQSNTQEVGQEIKNVGGVWVNVNKIAVDESKKSSGAIISDIQAISAAIKSVPKIDYTGAGADGFASGGDPFYGGLGGYGGGDRRLILVEDGEHVIRKEAVARMGHSFFQGFNALNFPRLQKFAVGGPIGTSRANDNIIRHEHVISIGNSPSATVYSDDLNAGKLINMLKRAERLRS